MNREHHRIINSWVNTIRCAVFLMKDPDAAYRVTVGLARRVHELGYTW